MNKRLVIMLMFILLMLSTIQAYAAVGVRPLVIDMDVKPGESKTFDLTLLAEETQSIVNIDFFQPVQETNGRLTYIKGDAEKFSELQWVNLETNQIIVPPGEDTTIKGTVTVPYDARGSHTVIMMVEPVPKGNNTGLLFIVRYAVRLNINVESFGLRENLEILDFGLETNNTGKPFLSARLKNTSLLQYRAKAEISLRDENRRLVEREILLSEAAVAGNKETTTLFPGSEVYFTEEVKEAIFPGKYMLQLDASYGDGRRIIKRKDIAVGEGFMPEGKIQYLEITPDLVQSNLNSGGVHTQVMEFKNRTGDTLSVRIEGKDVGFGYEHSVFSGLDFQIRGEKEFSIPPRRSGRVVLIIRVPRDTKPGGYYGFLKTEVFSSDQLVESEQINIGLVVGNEWEYKAEILNIDHEKFADEHIFSIGLKNNSQVHINPRGKLQLKDEAGEIIKTLELKMREDRILPDKIGYLSNTVRNIENGKYTAEITIDYQNKEIARKVLILNVE